MQAVNVRQLKNNPSEALRKAQKEMVVVMNGDQPSAVLVHLEQNAMLAMPGIRLALANALFKEGSLPLARAAKLAQMALPEFMQQLSRAGIPVIHGASKEVKHDVETLQAWLASS
ncbi:MAG: type II toxin-antitoxin system Phd/YefM family antitoxin [Betaproteobacteria bacterium]|nr:type II toxin-antitoxin system Phd/YefM family antitoxin [Betaproteobacteria bacterium]